MKWVWLSWEWILTVLGVDLSGSSPLGVDLAVLGVDLAVWGVDLPACPGSGSGCSGSGFWLSWEWICLFWEKICLFWEFGGEFRFDGEFGSCGSKSSYLVVNSGTVA